MIDIYTIKPETPFEADQTIRKYQSLVWAERFSNAGDFELVTTNVDETIGQITKGSILAIRTSKYLMRTDEVKISKQDGGKYTLTAKGSSIETFFAKRAARLSGQNSDTEWTFNGVKPIATAISIFNSVISEGSMNAGDNIPYLEMHTNIDEASDPSVDIAIKSKDLYSAIRDILSAAKCGVFPHLYKDDVSGDAYLRLEVYRGVDRSIGQENPIIFHVANGDIVDPTYLFTDSNYYNVAYVFSKIGSQIVYADGVDPNISSWDRQVLYVDVTDVDNPSSAIMTERGKQELSKHSLRSIFDGKVNPISTTYETPDDYYLGDKLTLMGDFNIRQEMRVEEIIRISDDKGERTYPTLASIQED